MGEGADRRECRSGAVQIGRFWSRSTGVGCKDLLVAGVDRRKWGCAACVDRKKWCRLTLVLLLSSYLAIDDASPFLGAGVLPLLFYLN
ncbi:hypothetical protein E3N88_28907 [Mikania micrantha]|uniref:Uncharacterized protein n=1 Tax=Mikania micrantha TaxID=192012 RepID=A0A5N6N1T8_9ASTR|nr:hypothetical protein E3N88_28907 [Mikania micrantha]